MSMNTPPYLEKYSGLKSRYECPACHDKFSFTRYLNGDTEQMIDKTVGRCNREDKCGYHYTPSQYFRDNPQQRQNYGKGSEFKKANKNANSEDFWGITTHVRGRNQVEGDRNRGTVPSKEPGQIPKEYLTNSRGAGSNFVAFLCSLFDRYTVESPTIERLMDDYYLGQTKNGSVIYWQIDSEKRIRTGKIMQYDPKTGKRLQKVSGAIDWVHAKLKRDNTLPDDFNLVQCLFGEHLLPKYPDKTVYLVEGEKSAIIGSGAMPEYLWLSTGNKQNLKADMCRILKGRNVIISPDLGAFDQWKEKGEAIAREVGFKVIISDLLERVATDEERAAGYDIADWLIPQLQTARPEPGIVSEPEYVAEHPEYGIMGTTKRCAPLKDPAEGALSPVNGSTTVVHIAPTNEEKVLQSLAALNTNIYTLIDALDLVSATTGEKLRTQIN